MRAQMQTDEKEIRLYAALFIVSSLMALAVTVSRPATFVGESLGYILLALMLIIRQADFIDKKTARIIIILLGFSISFRYWYFRTTETLFYTGMINFAAMLVLYLAETYGILITSLSGFVSLMPYRRKVEPVSADAPDLPTVDVFVPTYSESCDIAISTVVAALSMRYPQNKLNVYILDDGGTLQKRGIKEEDKRADAEERVETFKTFIEYMAPQDKNLHYLTRPKNEHAKAGNINHALFFREQGYTDAETAELSSFSSTGDMPPKGDLVLILDCDHIPSEDFLLNTVGYFIKNKKLFLVQTPHFFINPDPIEKNLDTYRSFPSENEMFYGEIQYGLDSWGASFFCGSAAVMSRQHLEENGGLCGDTITEDAESALNMHAKGLESVYLGRPMVCGLSPETFTDFILQRNRWAQGMAQIFVLKRPLFMKGLTIPQRLCYLNSCIFWFFGLGRIIFMLAPLMYLFFGMRIYNVSLEQVAIYTVPHLLGALMMTDYLYGKVRAPFFSELYETVQSIFNLPAVISVMLKPKAPTFKVTPKNRSLEKDFLSPLAYPFYIILTMFMVSVPVAAWKWEFTPGQRDMILLTMLWSLYNIFLLFLCMGIVWEKKQIRKKHRINISEPILIKKSDGGSISVMISDISDEGLGILVKKGLMDITEGSVLNIETYDGKFSFRIRAVNIKEKADGLHVGAVFIMEDENTWINIINFTYGKSSRWVDFWLSRREKKPFFLDELSWLFMLSWRGLRENIFGVGRSLILSLNSKKDKFINKILQGVS